MINSLNVESPQQIDPKPSVGWILHSLPVEQIHHHRLRLRHPAGIYSLSLTRIAARFRSVLDELDTLRTDYASNGKIPDVVVLADRVESLLYCLVEHLEDCKNVLRILFASERSADKSPHYSHFDKEILSYRRRLGEIVNSIKHRTGRICGVILHNRSLFVPGYYVESAIDATSVGPDTNLHNGGDTAISLFRDLKYHFVHVYLIAHHLQNAVQSIWNSPLEPEFLKPKSEKLEFLELARRLILLPDVVYYDERLLPYPRIRIGTLGDQVNRLTLAFAHPDQSLRTFDDYQIRVSFQGDSFTKTIKLPYLRTGWQRQFLQAPHRN